MHLTRHKWIAVNLALFALLVISVFASLLIGSEHISLSEALGANTKARAILFMARLPRTILAAFVGMALASSGGAFQALLRNPLADPFILGISGGAALGSVLAIGLHLPFELISISAFISAAISMMIIFAVSGKKSKLNPTTLLLTGVIFNAFCFALILFINAVVTMEEAYQIVFLLIGNLEIMDMTTVAIVAIFVLAGFVTLCLCSSKMNLLSLGDDEARSMGVNITRLRILIFSAASVMVGAAVAASGLIGFVGLFIPHVIRLIFGADHRLLIPASGLAGAAFLVSADTAARTILMNTGFATQLPVGVITALIGAPMFMVLLRGSNR